MKTFLVGAAVLATACGDSGGTAGHDAGVDAAVPQYAEVTVPAVTPTALDVLFVVNDTPTMANEQQSLADNFKVFVSALDALPGGRPDLHIGVISSDLGTQGATDATPGPAFGTAGMGGCASTGKDGALQKGTAPITDAFIKDAPGAGGARVTNYPDGMQLPTVFAAMATLGAGGCQFPQPLQAVRHALAATNTANAGFLRNDAALAVVFVADTDDCSLSHASLLGSDTATLGPLDPFRCTRFGTACDTGGVTTDDMNAVGTKAACHPRADSMYLTPIADHVAFLKTLKADPARVAAAAVVGPTTPVAVELRSVAGNPIPQVAHSCSYIRFDGTTEHADPPLRITALLDGLLPSHAAAGTICEEEITSGLGAAGTEIRAAMGDPCFQARLVDSDPKTDGLQASCTVTTDAGTALPACTGDDGAASNAPCYRVVDDAVVCGRSTLNGSSRLVIEGGDQLAAAAHVTARCLLVAVQ